MACFKRYDKLRVTWIKTEIRARREEKLIRNPYNPNSPKEHRPEYAPFTLHSKVPPMVIIYLFIIYLFCFDFICNRPPFKFVLLHLNLYFQMSSCFMEYSAYSPIRIVGLLIWFDLIWFALISSVCRTFTLKQDIDGQLSWRQRKT